LAPVRDDREEDQRRRIRRAVANITTESWQSIPHFFVGLEADVEEGLKVAKPTPLVCAAVAQALARHPDCNLRWEDETAVERESVDIGLLVDSPAGLLMAVITQAETLGLADMSEAVGAAIARARSGSLSTADLGLRSVTISSLGMYSVDRFSVVIPRPDVLALAVGRAYTAATWDGGQFVPRTKIDLTFSVDHRALDGAAVARFLTTLERLIRDPVAEGLA
jgi:pyruvate dehydrogenase E2 component (dihydrolipoamide acetyltransferase)